MQPFTCWTAPRSHGWAAGMALAPLFGGLSHVASAQRYRPSAVSAAAGGQSKQNRKAGSSRRSSAKEKQLAPQQRRPGLQHAAAADAEPLASADPLAAGGDSVSPPETDAAAPAEVPQLRRGRKSKADKYKATVPVRTDSERSVAAITSILGGMQQKEAEKAAAAQAEEAAAKQQAEALAAEQAAAMQQAEALAAEQQLATQQEAEAAAAQQQEAETPLPAAEAEAADKAAADVAQQTVDAQAAAAWDKLHQWERDKIMDKAVYRASAQPNYEEQARLEKATAVAKHALRVAQRAELAFKKEGFLAGAEPAAPPAAGAQQADALLAERQRAGQQEAEAAAAEQRHLLEAQAAGAEELPLQATTAAAAAAQPAAFADAPTEPAMVSPEEWELVSTEPWQPGGEQMSQSSSNGGSSAGGSSHSVGSSNGISATRDGNRSTPRRQPLRPKTRWQASEEVPPWQGRSSGSGGGRYAPPLDADIEQRQRQIHIKVMKKWCVASHVLLRVACV